MSVTGIGGFGAAASALQSASAQGSTGTTVGHSAEQTFLDFMKKTAAERLVESWLAAHGLTKEEFDALPPEQHAALAKQMAEDLKAAMQHPKHAALVG